MENNWRARSDMDALHGRRYQVDQRRDDVCIWYKAEVVDDYLGM